MKVIKPLGIIIGALAVYYGIQIFYSFVFAVISIFVTDASFTAMEAYLMQQALPISLVSTVVTLTVFCLYPVMRRRNPLSYFYCRKIPLYALPLLLVFGLAASFTVNFIWSYLPFPEELWESYNETVNSMLGGDPVLAFLVIVICAPLLEELLFRAVLLKQFSRFMPSVLALILSSAIFAVAHGNLIQGSYAFACGLLLGFIFLRYQSVCAGILFHLGFNISSYVAELFPESSYFIVCLYAILVFATLFVLMMITTKKRVPQTEEEVVFHDEM